MYHYPLNLSSATMPKANTIIKTNNIFESLLTSRSNLPILTLASLEFISVRVSLPVYTTTASTWPEVARTVFAHIVFSKDKGSFKSESDSIPF